jgi:hypothetical protein
MSRTPSGGMLPARHNHLSEALFPENSRRNKPVSAPPPLAVPAEALHEEGTKKAGLSNSLLQSPGGNERLGRMIYPARGVGRLVQSSQAE